VTLAVYSLSRLEQGLRGCCGTPANLSRGDHREGAGRDLECSEFENLTDKSNSTARRNATHYDDIFQMLLMRIFHEPNDHIE
jgi:hypothetical protein